MKNWQAGYSVAELDELARLLCGNFGALPSPALLRAANLEAWAYIALPRDDPRRNACRRAFLDARGRHALLKGEVHDMVRAWNAAGIVPLLYKGFALAEFVYPQPGMRFHGDVDILVRPQDFERALAVGHSGGWHTPRFDHPAILGVDPYELSLKRKGANASFDLHQRLMRSLGPGTSRERELTQLAWEDSVEVVWEGAKVRLLSRADSFLYGLVLARCWSGDNWTPKPHDILDGINLISKGLTKTQIMQRSSQIGIKCTAEVFMRHCDPFNRVFSLKKNSRFKIIVYELKSSFDHFPSLLGNIFVKIRNLLLFTPDLPGFLISLVSVRYSLFRLGSLDRAVPRLAARPKFQIFSVRSSTSIWWWARRFRLTNSLLWPMVTYIYLKRIGVKAVLKSGIVGEQRIGWVEVEGVPLAEFQEEYPTVLIMEGIFERD